MRRPSLALARRTALESLGSRSLCGILATLIAACGESGDARRPTDVVAQVSDDISTVVNVRWKTDEVSGGYVQYGPTEAMEDVDNAVEGCTLRVLDGEDAKAELDLVTGRAIVGAIQRRRAQRARIAQVLAADRNANGHRGNDRIGHSRTRRRQQRQE